MKALDTLKTNHGGRTVYGQQARAAVWGRTGAESVPQDLSSYRKNPNGCQLSSAKRRTFPEIDASVDVFINKLVRKVLDTMKTKHGGRTVHGQQARSEVWGREMP